MLDRRRFGAACRATLLAGLAAAATPAPAHHGWSWATDAPPPLRLRAAGALSIALWLSVIVCGRMLAFLD